MRYVVTRDQTTEFKVSKNDVAVWKESAFDSLNMDSTGEWDANPDEMLFELPAEEFETEFDVAPPQAGTKTYLKAAYEWE